MQSVYNSLKAQLPWHITISKISKTLLKNTHAGRSFLDKDKT